MLRSRWNEHTCPKCGVSGPIPMMLDATRFQCGTMYFHRNQSYKISETCIKNAAEKEKELKGEGLR